MANIENFTPLTERYESESRYKRLVESITDYIYTVFIEDGQPIRTLHRPGCLAVTGFTSQEYEDNPHLWLSMVYQDDRESVTRQASAVLSGEKVEPLEHRIIHKDGTVLWVRNTPVQRFDEKGVLISYDGLIQNVTERKQAEVKLLAVSSRHESLLSAIPDIIVEVDNNKIITWANLTGIEFYGEDVVGKEVSFYFEGEQETYKTVAPIFNGNEDIVYVESWQRRKDGQERLLAWWCRVLKDANGNVTGALSTARDITEQISMQNEIIQGKKEWEEVFDTINDAITIHDADFNIIRANKTAVATLGISLFEILRQKCYKSFHGTECPPAGCPSCSSLETGLPSVSRMFEPHMNKHLEIKALPRFDKDNRIIGLIHIVRDISAMVKAEEEQKKLTEQLLQSQKMESIGVLAGGVAHDFNNILQAIIGFGAFALKRAKDDPTMQKYIQEILDSANRAAELTRGLLAYSRKQVISPKVADLNSLVINMEKMLQRIIGEDIELRTVLSGRDIPVTVDAAQIDQVLLNLVTNAHDAMPEGGHLIIETGIVNIDRNYAEDHLFEKTGKYAVLTVSDTGVGMDLKTRENIFEPFFTTKGIGRGTGLGLAMVYGIIKQHDGNIHVYSEPGKGTRFRIYLPLAKTASDKETVDADEPLPLGHGETILMAEDDAQVRRILKLTLEEHGYKVIEAENGEAAVRMFRDNADKVSLLLLDVVMPIKNGRAAYEEIKVLSPDIKVLYMSGYTDSMIAKKGILEEGFDFVSKPIDPDTLLRRVGDILDR